MASRKERKEFEHLYRMRLLQVFSVAWHEFTRVLCIAIPCVFAYLAVRELAGKQTLADISFKVLADLKANKWMAYVVPWGLAGATTLWGAGERYLRKRHIKRISSEGSEMQKQIDAGRRSSSLNKKGENHPEDY